MTDKELLEYAAKAAGLENEPCKNGWDEKYPLGWNPLEDDGDALRLAVKLGLWVDLHRPDTFTRVCPEQEDLSFTQVIFNGDPYSATRRSIVECAAEIGKAMQ